jgi:diguanylate cyclase (GGDEF)-like protein
MKILIAEDDAVSRSVLEGFLTKWGYQVVATSDGGEALEALQGEDAPQLAILDWMMPGMDGVEVCREVRKRGSEPYVYILLLTARDQRRDVVEGIEAGADDYLTKPFDVGELRSRLRAGRRILGLQGALISARDALRFQATHDPLTGLWNRLATLDALRRETARSAREKSSVGVVMADLDHFKSINDTYGHLTGDAALREVARRMRSSVRLYDTVGRYGGEEFLLVLPGCDVSRVLVQAERIRAAFLGEPLDLADARVTLTVSLGVAGVEPDGRADTGSLVRAVDQALYRAKSRGRNCVEAATDADLYESLPAASIPRAARHRRHNGGR